MKRSRGRVNSLNEIVIHSTDALFSFPLINTPYQYEH
ncbi:MAG: hypothetical protein GFH27_549303n269 [Chloroflexi bacterium AL-W]|nr:hypothetical protein [Chloroflexi bacterium AL-N1]NOK68154.1 hypothetical protein [Chloroflexi bacterium AL-N10]NOK73494.1 hypothetical protein [Chloroflexi bacterium AL-N5]NOK83408.1 hypothetical protein [Chloroflexi bacterium AL-W]NOK87825.1 hypothetical protein [Chloroflexi bacterium AL-N15]